MAVMTIEPVKSQQDQKSYKRLKLDNGLDVMLIHDPEMEASSSGDADADMTTDDEHDRDGSSLQGTSEEDAESADDDSGDTQHVKKAAAAMAVGVGSFSDPDDVPGMSHYLEHMLFMGSEKFPDENDYDSYLQHNGGAANAYTEMEYTNYYFDCNPAALHGALDRFSQFFVAPLCKADALEREVNAVDNEFSGVQQDDTSRLAQLRCHTAKDGHIYRKFTWGNRKSLVEIPASKNIDVRSELVQYYKNNYSAERMVLVLLGGEPLETLEQWVKELFLAVPSGRGPRPAFGHLGRPYQGGRMHVVPAVRQGHSLTLTFQLPSLFKEYRAKPDDYVSHLLGHEGRGSLLSALKAKGWATAISAGVNESGYERNTAVFVFEATITLTEAGLHQAPGLGLATVPLVFSYIEMLRQAGPQRWVFDELAAVAEQRFRFADDEEASEYVSRLAASLPLYAPEHALNGPHVHEAWRPDLVTEILDCMVPSNCRLDLQSSAFEELKEKEKLLSASGAVASTEPWFDLPYVALSLPADTLKAWEQPPSSSAEGLAMPQQNHFIPADFSLKSDTAASKDSTAKQAAEALLTAVPAHNAKADNGHAKGADEDAVQPLEDPPNLIADAPGLQIWHKLDRTFKRPIALAYLCITPRCAYDSARTAALTHLVLKLLQDDVNETAYLADVAGLGYDVWPEGLAGMELKVNGFSHKLPLLLEQLVKALVTLKVDEGSFVRNKEALVQKYQNANMSPDRHASYLRLRALKQMWRMEDVLAELQALTPAGVQESLAGLLRDTHITAMVHGNFTAEEAFEMASSVRKMLSDGIMTASERSVDRVAVLPHGTTLHMAPVKNAEETNSVAEVYCQVGPNSRAQRARLDMFEQMFSEPFYDTLRTKEQLGYSVHLSTRLTHGILGFAFVVISGVHGPAHLQKRIDAFLEGLAPRFGKIGAEEFEADRRALIAAKLQKDHALSDEADRNWEQISNRRYNFLAREEEAAELERMTLKDVQETYEAFLKPSSQAARRLCVHVVGKEHAQELKSAEPSLGKLMPDISDFRNLEHYPPVLGELPPIAQD